MISPEIMSATETMQRITLLYRSSTFGKKKASSLKGREVEVAPVESTSQNRSVNDLLHVGNTLCTFPLKKCKLSLLRDVIVIRLAKAQSFVNILDQHY